MSNIKLELLRENPKALQFINEAMHIDFEKDFLILKFENRFTYNQLKKEIDARINGKYIAALLLKTTDRYHFNKELYFVEMSHGKFYPLRENNNLRYWSYNMSWFHSIGDFEDVRKNKTSHIYVIAQKIENLSIKKVKEIDLSQRFNIENIRKCGDGMGNTWISEVNLITTDGSNTKTIFAPNKHKSIKERENDLSRIIDKSGYILTLHRENMERRAKQKKEEKEKAAFLQKDFTLENNLLRAKIVNTKNYISRKMAIVETFDDAQKVADAAKNFQWLMLYFEKHDEKINNKSFLSVKATEKSFADLNERISLIFDTLEEK